MKQDQVKRSSVQLVDTTLRDGSHAMSHSFTKEQVKAIAGNLDKAGVSWIEISHGDGLGGSSYNYGMSAQPELSLIQEAVSQVGTSKIAALILPGIGTKTDLEEAKACGIGMIRVASHVTEANVTIGHIKAAKEMKLVTAGFLMMVHMAEPQVIVEQARRMQDAGADYINLADSAGYLTPDGVRARVSLLKERLEIPIGFHAHNNLGLANANALAAVEEGASYIDATLRGLGAGAGNCQEEVLAAVLNRESAKEQWNLELLMEAAEKLVDPIMKRPQIIDNGALMLGYAGVYSSFLLHARRAASVYGIPVSDILRELGRRQMVGGQEDRILEVASQLAQQRNADK